MGHLVVTRFLGPTVVAWSWLLILAIAGRPWWLAVLLGAAIVLVWLSPFLLAANRQRPAPSTGLRLRPVRAGKAGPASWPPPS
jgi:hypothetical protein